MTPESGNEFTWSVQEFHGSWTPGLNAGGCLNNVATFHQNPQFLVELKGSIKISSNSSIGAHSINYVFPSC